ncbi:MAG: DUF3100 domain-containing protein [Pseudomonadota bacterium]
MPDAEDSILSLWRLHAVLILSILIAEWIGVIRLPVGGLTLVFLPLIFAFFVAIAFNPNIAPWAKRFLSARETKAAASGLSIAVIPLIALLSAYIGPQFQEVASVGLALVLQELGNLGTMAIAMPVGVLIFGMGREAIGATFSIAREGGLAFIFGKFGGGSPEGAGVMGVYICGTVFGVIFFSLAPSLVAALDIFDPRALAMACGTGSASMTGACSTTVAAAYPDQAEQIVAIAASSNLMTGLTGLFIIIFITLPLAERYYTALTRMRLEKEGKSS